MASTYRIPKAELTGAYGTLPETVTRRMWGKVPDNLYVAFHHTNL